MKSVACVVLLLIVGVPAAADVDWSQAAGPDVVEIVTSDEDGELRETSVWIVTFDGHGYVRTNDSRWLANIRRGSSVAVRVDDVEYPVAAREVDDPATIARTEAGFREKYGFVQRVMSTFRMREPTTLELSGR